MCSRGRRGQIIPKLYRGGVAHPCCEEWGRRGLSKLLMRDLERSQGDRRVGGRQTWRISSSVIGRSALALAPIQLSMFRLRTVKATSFSFNGGRRFCFHFMTESSTSFSEGAPSERPFHSWAANCTVAAASACFVFIRIKRSAIVSITWSHSRSRSA